MFANISFLASFGATFAAAVILLGCVLICWKKGLCKLLFVYCNFIFLIKFERFTVRYTFAC